MSFIGGLFNGSQGTNYQGGQPQNLIEPSTAQQAADQYGNVNQGLNQQQAFINAVNGQNGLGNQSQVYGQLQGVANGTGPNPAQAMLAQSTGQNVAAQGALAAGQRGSSANAGLIARQAAQAGSQAQQQAAGQAATMQAQQSLGALSAAGQMANQQVAQQAQAIGNYNQFAQGSQSNILNSIAQQNSANVGAQGSINSANSGVAQVNAGNQGKLGAGILSGFSGLGGVLGATGGEVKADQIGNNPKLQQSRVTLSSGGGVDAPTPTSFSQYLANFGKASQQQQQDPVYSAGAKFGAGVANLGKSLFSSSPDTGGVLPVTNPGGAPDMNAALQNNLGYQGFGTSSVAAPAEATTSMVAPAAAADSGSALAASGAGGVLADLGPAAVLAAAHGGKVPALLSPGEKYLPPTQAKKVAQGKESPMKGKTVPGQAKVSGDSLVNDTFKTTLQEGGVVIPRSVMGSKNPEKAAAAFVRAHLGKQALRKK